MDNKTLVISATVLIFFALSCVNCRTSSSPVLKFEQCVLNLMCQSPFFVDNDRVLMSKVTKATLLTMQQLNLDTEDIRNARVALRLFSAALAHMVSNAPKRSEMQNRKSAYLESLEQCSSLTSKSLVDAIIDEALRILSPIQEVKSPYIGSDASFQDSSPEKNGEESEDGKVTAKSLSHRARRAPTEMSPLKSAILYALLNSRSFRNIFKPGLTPADAFFYARSMTASGLMGYTSDIIADATQAVINALSTMTNISMPVDYALAFADSITQVLQNYDMAFFGNGEIIGSMLVSQLERMLPNGSLPFQANTRQLSTGNSRWDSDSLRSSSSRQFNPASGLIPKQNQWSQPTLILQQPSSLNMQAPSNVQRDPTTFNAPSNSDSTGFIPNLNLNFRQWNQQNPFQGTSLINPLPQIDTGSPRLPQIASGFNPNPFLSNLQGNVRETQQTQANPRTLNRNAGGFSSFFLPDVSSVPVESQVETPPNFSSEPQSDHNMNDQFNPPFTPDLFGPESTLHQGSQPLMNREFGLKQQVNHEVHPAASQINPTNTQGFAVNRDYNPSRPSFSDYASSSSQVGVAIEQPRFSAGGAQNSRTVSDSLMPSPPDFSQEASSSRLIPDIEPSFDYFSSDIYPTDYETAIFESTESINLEPSNPDSFHQVEKKPNLPVMPNTGEIVGQSLLNPNFPVSDFIPSDEIPDLEPGLLINENTPSNLEIDSPGNETSSAPDNALTSSADFIKSSTGCSDEEYILCKGSPTQLPSTITVFNTKSTVIADFSNFDNKNPTSTMSPKSTTEVSYPAEVEIPTTKSVLKEHLSPTPLTDVEQTVHETPSTKEPASLGTDDEDIELRDPSQTFAEDVSSIASYSIAFIKSPDFNLPDICRNLNKLAPIVDIPPLDTCSEIAVVDYVLHVLKAVTMVLRSV